MFVVIERAGARFFSGTLLIGSLTPELLPFITTLAPSR
jgi:hypothetical protein